MMAHFAARKGRAAAYLGVMLLALPTIAAAASNTIVVADPFMPTSGFALESDDAQVMMKAGCLEALTRVGFDGEVAPGLAVSWTQTSPTTWNFTLRPGVRFGDGRPLDAAAVAGALTRTLKAPAPARAFSPKVVTGVAAIDAQTVQITTPAPSVLVPLRMASPNTGILSPGAFHDDGISPVHACTGPFDIVEDVPRQMLRLVRNANYWGGAVGYPKAEYRYVPDGQVRATMVQTGEAQIATVLPVSVLRQPVSGLRVLTIPLPRTTSLILNAGKPPFDDPRVRQAIQAALDTAGIAGSIYEGLAKPAIGPFAPTEPWVPKDGHPITQDVRKARSLLASAGINPAAMNMEIWVYQERPELADLASVIQAELADVGIDAKIRAASYNALEPDLLEGQFSSMLLSRSHLTDVADPGAFLVSDYACKGGFNIAHFCDVALDEAISQAVALTGSGDRFARYAEIASRLERDAASVFIVHEQQRDAVKGVDGYRIHPLGHYILTKDLKPGK